MGLIEQITGFFGGAPEEKILKDNEPKTGMTIREVDSSILKAVMPQYLYKPPFGYPRKVNVSALRELGKNPYVFSIIKTLCDEASSTSWDIVEKEDNEDRKITPNEDTKHEIIDFLNNPNENEESFQHLIRCAVRDICEVDAGVWVKVFNSFGELVQLYARDGGSFLKNPDIYGTIQNRDDFVEPLSPQFYGMRDYRGDGGQLMQAYDITYSDKSAYYQYGQSFTSFPIPFGRREIVYMMQNPQANDIYGCSPLEYLLNVILTLHYGSKFYLDFYLNNNMPEGMIVMEGIQKDDMDAFSHRMSDIIREGKDELGFQRKKWFKTPISPFPADFIPFTTDPSKMGVIEQQKWFDRILMRCFGVTETEMGTTDNANKATAITQTDVFKRKAVKPILALMAYHINTQILPEFEGYEGWEFRWDDYNLDDDIKKHTLYESQIRMGIKTPEMIAEEEGIDVEKLKQQKEEERQQKMDDMEKQASFNSFNGQGTFPKPSEKINKEKEQGKKPLEKKTKGEEEIEEIREYVKEIGKALVKEFEKVSEGEA